MQHERLRYTRPAQYVAGASMLLRWRPAPANLLASDPQSLRICAALSSDLRPHCSIAQFCMVRANWARKSFGASKEESPRESAELRRPPRPPKARADSPKAESNRRSRAGPSAAQESIAGSLADVPAYRRASAVLAQRQRTRRREHSGYVRLILFFRMFI